MRPLSFLLALALPAASQGLIETRVNLLATAGLGGQGALLEHDWILSKPLGAEKPTWYRPTLGLFAGWAHANEEFFGYPAEFLGLGFSTKFWAIPGAYGANGFITGRFGLNYVVNTEWPGREGFAKHWAVIEISGGYNFPRRLGVHPCLEVYYSIPMIAGLRIGLSLPLLQRLPLPPDPPPRTLRGPRFHLALGGVFTSELASFPIYGEKWFGGQIDVGVSAYRFTENRHLVVGTRITAAGADPAALRGRRSVFRSAAATLGYQDLGEPGGIGFKVTGGYRYYLRYYDDRGFEEVGIMPVISGAILARTRSGFYPFFDMGMWGGSPPVLGIGRSF